MLSLYTSATILPLCTMDLTFYEQMSGFIDQWKSLAQFGSDVILANPSPAAVFYESRICSMGEGQSWPVRPCQNPIGVIVHSNNDPPPPLFFNTKTESTPVGCDLHLYLSNIKWYSTSIFGYLEDNFEILMQFEIAL